MSPVVSLRHVSPPYICKLRANYSYIIPFYVKTNSNETLVELGRRSTTG